MPLAEGPVQPVQPVHGFCQIFIWSVGAYRGWRRFATTEIANSYKFSFRLDRLDRLDGDNKINACWRPSCRSEPGQVGPWHPLLPSIYYGLDLVSCHHLPPVWPLFANR
jgi:hypothetical protein